MAAGKTSSYKNQYQARNRKNIYVYGNTVARPDAVPKKQPEERVSDQPRRRRKQRAGVGVLYAGILTAAAGCAVILCALYLNLQADTIKRSETVTELQEDLAKLTEQNNTMYQAAENSVNLETVRARAIYELGMIHFTQGRVVEYKKPAEEYVTQYSDIPENGILVQSGSGAK